MPNHVAIAALVTLALSSACDLTTAPPDATLPQIANDTTTTNDEDQAQTTTTTDAKSTTGRDELASTSTDAEHEPPPDQGTPTTTGEDESTGNQTTSDTEPGCTADVMLSLDVSVQNFWPLRRLAGQVVAIDGALRANGVDARWYVMPWIDALGAVDTLEGWGSDPDAFAAANAVETWASLSQANVQPDGTGSPNLEADDAGLSSLAAVAAWDGWRPGAVRVVVHVTDSGVVEAPAVLSGYPVIVKYADTAAALVAAEVHTVAWAPAEAPGYTAPWVDDTPAVAAEARDVAAEKAPNLTDPEPGYRDAVVEFIASRAACVP